MPCALPLQALEGSISAALVTPDLRHAGTFRASFLVVSALPHPANNLGNLQRTRWVPGGSTLDIGCGGVRGGGASGMRQRGSHRLFPCVVRHPLLHRLQMCRHQSTL